MRRPITLATLTERRLDTPMTLIIVILPILVSILASIGTLVSWLWYPRAFEGLALVASGAVVLECLVVVGLYIWVLLSTSYLK
jgi:hypothetical protein